MFSKALIQKLSVGHKWLQVPYDCGLFYTRDTSFLTNGFQPPASSAPAHLSAAKPSPQYDNLFTDTGEQQAYALHELSEGTVKVRSISSRLWVNIENSRRFKALPLTVGLLSLGKDGYRGKKIIQITVLVLNLLLSGFSDDTFLQTLSLATSSLHGEQQSASFNHPSYLLPARSSNIDSGAFLALLHLCLKKSDVRYRKMRDLYGLIIESP